MSSDLYGKKPFLYYFAQKKFWPQFLHVWTFSVKQFSSLKLEGLNLRSKCNPWIDVNNIILCKQPEVYFSWKWKTSKLKFNVKGLDFQIVFEGIVGVITARLTHGCNSILDSMGISLALTKKSTFELKLEIEF
jgi:hypothetical protein